MIPNWAGPMFWWMANNLITNDTYDSRAASLHNSAVQTTLLWRRMSRVIPSNRTFEVALIESHKALKMIRDVRSLKSRLKTRSFLVESKTSSNEVYNDFESDMAVVINKKGNLTRETAKSNIIVMQNAGSQILTLEVQAKNSDLWDTACILVMLYTRIDNNDWPRKIPFRNSVMWFISVYLAEPPPKLLTLRGHPIVGGGCHIASRIFTDKGCW